MNAQREYLIVWDIAYRKHRLLERKFKKEHPNLTYMGDHFELYDLQFVDFPNKQPDDSTYAQYTIRLLQWIINTHRVTNDNSLIIGYAGSINRDMRYLRLNDLDDFRKRI